MKGTAEPRNHVYDIVGALHSVHDELESGINEYCCQENVCDGIGTGELARAPKAGCFK